MWDLKKNGRIKLQKMCSTFFLKMSLLEQKNAKNGKKYIEGSHGQNETRFRVWMAVILESFCSERSHLQYRSLSS